MTETAEKPNGEEPEATPQVNLDPEIKPGVKPEMPADMAAWLVTKLDTPIELNNHAERNNFAACINRLIAIANWKPEGQ